LIAIKIFNDENSPFSNMFEFKKEEINKYVLNLKEFELTNDEDDQKSYLMKRDTFSELKSLRSLKISFGYNQTIELEKEILDEMPSSLDHLDLSFNNIKDINSICFGKLKNLRRLVLHNNNIKFINYYIFNGLTNLQVLELKKNIIPIVRPEMFNNLFNLRYLDLSECVIEEIKDFSFSNLNFLKYLNLSDNLYEDISKNTFSGLNNLLELYLCNNFIKRIEDESFSIFGKLKILDLTNQNITQLKYFYEQYKRGSNNFDRLGLKNNGVKIKANF
jgi:Leucine-rich repeat (LRR) protein